MTKKLQIGCGKVYLPPEEGWTNCDIFSSVRADVYSDMFALPFEKESFDLLYICHVLEHAHRHMVITALSHWRSLLKPGGILRIAVPNFQAVCEHYQEHKDIKILMGLLFGAQDWPLNRHTVAFDEKYLTELLIKAGFQNVHWWDWKDTEHAKWDDFSRAHLPHMDFNGKLMSLNLECKK
jgi:predicted SAM-dependent methyltransferase